MEHKNQISFKNIKLTQKERLDKLILRLIKQNSQNFSRSKIQKIIKELGVILDGIKVYNPDQAVSEAKTIIIPLPEPESTTLTPKNSISFEIIFEDEDIIVINKPAGITVHPGAGNYSDTLANELVGYAQNLSQIGGFDRPGIVHRLDKDTSGLMVVAKNDQAHFELSKQLETRTLSRNYYALVYGIPTSKSGIIHTNIGRDYNNRKKMRVTNLGGKEAITYYQVKQIFATSVLALIECKLKTGRTHQIRVHMNHLGYPLVGDQTYNNNRKFYNHQLKADIKEILKNFPRQVLHSYKIAFIHPRTKQIMQYEIDLPHDISYLLNQLE